MKQCPNCQKTFDDAMRFCQTDGTPLIEMSETDTDDPYKTTIGRKEDLTAAPPLDPFKTMVGGGANKDNRDNSPQFSEDQDSLKTMSISDEEMKREMSDADQKQEAIIEIPPLASDSASADKNYSSFESPLAATFNDPGLSPPSFGDLASGSQSTDSRATDDASSPFSGSTPYAQKTVDRESKNPFDNSAFNQSSPPIPSPFNDAKPTSFEQPSAPLPTYKETEPLSYDQNDPFSQSPFNQSSMPVNQPLQQTEWTPPPAPDVDWRNQEIGANTPFQPPASGTGQNQTLAIVSLILGVIGIVLCQITAPAAIITGFMARKKAEQNPTEYGGSGLALAGIITGAIGTLLLVLVVIYLIVLFGVILNQ